MYVCTVILQKFSIANGIVTQVGVLDNTIDYATVHEQ